MEAINIKPKFHAGEYFCNEIKVFCHFSLFGGIGQFWVQAELGCPKETKDKEKTVKHFLDIFIYLFEREREREREHMHNSGVVCRGRFKLNPCSVPSWTQGSIS